MLLHGDRHFFSCCDACRSCKEGFSHSSEVNRVQLSPSVHYYTDCLDNPLWSDYMGTVLECRKFGPYVLVKESWNPGQPWHFAEPSLKFPVARKKCVVEGLNLTLDQALQVCRDDPDCAVLHYEHADSMAFAGGACQSPCLTKDSWGRTTYAPAHLHLLSLAYLFGYTDILSTGRIRCTLCTAYRQPH